MSRSTDTSGRRPLAISLLLSLRPGQWTKNLIVFAGLLLALSYIGGEGIQVALGVSDQIARVFQGMLLFFVLACDTFIFYRIRFVSSRPQHAPALEAKHGRA